MKNFTKNKVFKNALPENCFKENNTTPVISLLSTNTQHLLEFKKKDFKKRNDYQADSDNSSFIKFYNELSCIKKSLINICDGIRAVHFQQESKKRNCEKLLLEAELNDCRIMKLEKKLRKNEERTRRNSSIIINIEKIHKELSNFPAKKTKTLKKHFFIEKAAKTLKKFSKTQTFKLGIKIFD